MLPGSMNIEEKDLSTLVQPGQPVILKSAAETPHLPYLERPYAYTRRRTREVMVGSVGVGGNNPIRVQSMTTTLTKDVEATLAQTLRLVDAGCEIVRITTPTSADARALGEVLVDHVADEAAGREARERVLAGQDRVGEIHRRVLRRQPALQLCDGGARPRRHGLCQGLHAQGSERGY